VLLAHHPGRRAECLEERSECTQVSCSRLYKKAQTSLLFSVNGHGDEATLGQIVEDFELRKIRIHSI
jgi:hypothetical protein